MQCPRCQTEIPQGSKFCIKCGARQEPGTAEGEPDRRVIRVDTTDRQPDLWPQARQHLDRAYECENLHDLGGAMRECEAALRVAPQWPEALNLLGVILEQLDRLDEAIAAYREALRQDPRFDQARKNLNAALADRAPAGPAARRARLAPDSLSSRAAARRRSSAETAGGLTGIVGGATIGIGWITPWFGVGGWLTQLAQMANLTRGPSFLSGLTRGIGSGLQLTIVATVGGIAALTSDSLSGLVLLAFILAAVLGAIPVMAISLVRTGIQMLEARSSSGEPNLLGIRTRVQTLRRRSGTVIAIMVALFVLLSIIPFGTSVLGMGFYLTAAGAIGTFLAALLLESRIRD